VASQPTDRDGIVTFDLSTNLVQRRWYFEVTPNPPWPQGPSKLLFDVGRPLIGKTFLSLATEGFETLKTASNPYNVTSWNPNFGALDVKFRSCVANEVAGGLTIHIDGAPDAAGARYYNASAQLGPASGSTFAAYVPGISPGLHTVTATDSTGTTVSEERYVPFEADAVTVMSWLEPKTKE
jgi:hypothetical protein